MQCGKNIPELLDENARRLGKRTAYIFDDQRWSWQAVKTAADQTAEVLKQWGIQKGDRVGILGVNTIQWIISYFAVLKCGAVAVLFNYSWRGRELKEIISYVCVKMLLVGEAREGMDYRQILADIPADTPGIAGTVYMNELIAAAGQVKTDTAEESPVSNPGETAIIIFTSGTTKRPKGVMLGHDQIIDAMSAVASRAGWHEDDVLLMPLPLFHGSGANAGLMTALITGMTSVIQRSFHSAPALEAIEKYRCTIFNAVPSMILMMIRNEAFENYDLSSLRSGTLSGSTINAETFRKISEAFPGVDFLPAYGMTETSTLNTMCLPGKRPEEKNGSAGPAFEGMQLRILDLRTGSEAETGNEGEIQLRGECVMHGYFDMPEETKKTIGSDGWMHTGDVGYMDEAGELHFKTRLSEMIIRGGENVAPAEVELCIESYGDVIDMVKVVGVPDPVMQEEIAAVIKAKSELDICAVKEYLMQHLACFKVPKYFIQLSEMPMTGSGKIDAKTIKKIVIDELKGGCNHE